jgi:hypothetical protein
MMRELSRKSDETSTRTSGLCPEAKGMVCFNALAINKQ